MRGKHLWILVGCVLLVAGFGLWLVCGDSPADRHEKALARARADATEKVLRYGKTGDAGTRRQGHDMLTRKFREARGKSAAEHIADAITTTTDGVDDKKRKSFRPTFTAEERALMDKAFSALSSESVEKARAVAKEARRSKSPDVRKAAVEALGRYGEAGLVELAEFLGDEDAEVAEMAKDLFALSVQQIDEDAERVSVAKLAMLSMDNRAELDEMSGVLTLSTDHALVIGALADVILDGTAVQSAAAKDAYEAVTGNPWTGLDAAESWLQENYDPATASGADSTPEHEDIVITAEDILGR